MGKVTDILNKFNNRKSYQDEDRRALDVSRKANAGNLGEGEYADWALISNDPLVMVNSVKTFINIMQARLSSSPFRPEDNELKQLGIKLRLNSFFTKIYGDVLCDGYAYCSIGMQDGRPIVTPVDARCVLFTGDNQTLDDSTDVVIFTIKPLKLDEDTFDIPQIQNIPTEFVQYDSQKERVEVAHYSIRNGVVTLEIYDRDDEPRESYTIPGINRIPVVRFCGDEIEIEQRPHYRGIYHFVGSVLKALVLAATKIQINTATFEDNNWLAPYDAISNHTHLWNNTGVKTYDDKNANGLTINPPTPINKPMEFLINAYNTWKVCIEGMLGHLITESKSEAITEQEVKARNEVRDAITNNYMTKMADSISAVYTIIQGLLGNGNEPVIIVGGFLEEVKRNKEKQELMTVYQLAKESGLNVQGFAYELLALSDVNEAVKSRIQQTFAVSPNNNPLVVELQQKLQQLQQQSEKALAERDRQIAILRTQSTQRMERQADYVDMKERQWRSEMVTEQWKQEQKEAQQGRLEAMKYFMQLGDTENVLKILGAMEQRDNLLLSQNKVDELISENDAKAVALLNKQPHNDSLVTDTDNNIAFAQQNNPNSTGVLPDGV